MSSKTISGREIKVTPNHSKQTFTIRVDGSKYRTIRMSKGEFDEALYMTAEDWLFALILSQ
jgi:hypothetical protein